MRQPGDPGGMATQRGAQHRGLERPHAVADERDQHERGQCPGRQPAVEPGKRLVTALWVLALVLFAVGWAVVVAQTT